MALKPKLMVAPVMALAIGGAWLAFQGRAVSALGAENAKLRERVTAAEGPAARGEAGTRNGAGGARGRTATAGETARKLLADPRLPLDWKAIGVKLVEIDQGNSSTIDERFILRLTDRLAGMSRDELKSTLGEIGASGMPASSRKAILEKLLDPLMEKDPAWAMTRYIHDGLVDSGTLAGAFDHWATMDLTAGIGWLDERIKEGLLDGKSPDQAADLRLELEAKLLVPLLSDNQEKALARLEAIPEQQRAELLRGMDLSEVVDTRRNDFVGLLRKYLPEEEVEQEIISNLPNASPNKVDRLYDSTPPPDAHERASIYLDQVAALPKERERATLEVAENELGVSENPQDPKALAALRSWIETQVPGKSASVTGITLAGAIDDDFSFEQASALVVEYDKSRGSQDGLVEFLKRLASPELQGKAMRLVNGIADPAVRDEILKGYQAEEGEEE